MLDSPPGTKAFVENGVSWRITNTEKKQPETPTEVYKVVVNAMHGDADAEEDFVIYVKTNKEFARLLVFLDKVNTWYPQTSKNIQPEQYPDYPEWDEFFGEDWPYDITSGDDRRPCAIFGNISLSYIDWSYKEWHIERLPL